VSIVTTDTCTVWGSTDATLPFTNWYVLGSATETSAGQYQFTDLQATNQSRCFYRVLSPRCPAGHRPHPTSFPDFGFWILASTTMLEPERVNPNQ
jgi:hypothetical protein